MSPEKRGRLIQHLYGIYLAEDDKEANQALGAFIDTYQHHPLAEFEKLTQTLLEWGDEIFALHDTDRITNGRIEGTNNKLGVLKRVAYGFVNTTNFAARALLLTPGMPTSMNRESTGIPTQRAEPLFKTDPRPEELELWATEGVPLLRYEF